MSGAGEHSVVASSLVSLVRDGVAVVVATRDEELRPEISRAWGPDVSPDGSTVTLCVIAPPGSKARSNIEGNGAIAATFSVPTTYRTVQVKGVVLEVGEATREHLARVEEHIAAFAEQVEQLGILRSRAPRLAEGGLAAVRFTADEVYDQTPGPKAGSPL